MTQKPKRPPSVWISQVILVFYLLIFLGALAMTLVGVASINTAAGGAVVILLALLVFGFFISILAVAFWGLMKRRSWGRWLTVGILSLMVGLAILQLLSRMLTEGNGSGAYRAGQMFGSMLIIIPFAYLVFRLATGDPAHDFFNPPDEPSEMFEPPPPPTFTE